MVLIMPRREIRMLGCRIQDPWLDDLFLRNGKMCRLPRNEREQALPAKASPSLEFPRYVWLTITNMLAGEAMPEARVFDTYNDKQTLPRSDGSRIGSVVQNVSSICRSEDFARRRAQHSPIATCWPYLGTANNLSHV